MIQLKQIDLKFLSEENGKPCHKHILNGKEVPGCTSVSGLFQDDGWKFAWPPKLAVERIKQYLSRGIPLNDDILKEAKNAWREKRDRAANKGTAGHLWIQKYVEQKIKSGQAAYVLPTADEEILNIVTEFLAWEDTAKPVWLASEIQIGSEAYGFAGILDALATIDGKLTLLDFKSSSSIKDDYAIQLAGLCICLEELGLTVEQRAILHIPKDGEHEFRLIDSDLEADKKAFLAGLEFYKHRNIFFARNKGGNKFD